MTSTTAKGQKTILLVDDEDYLVLFLGKLLSGEGYNLITASNGRQAVDILEANPGGIDLVLMDITMPVMSGIEAFFEISRLDQNMPILLMSAYSRESLNCLGYPHFIQKPMLPAELFNAIRQTIVEFASCSNKSA